MTSLAVWTGVDSRSQSSIYIATDSRISWMRPTGKVDRIWNSGSKKTASPRKPDIFGYVGDVFYPSHTLDAVTEILGSSRQPRTIEESQDIFGSAVESAWADVPDLMGVSCSLVHCTRVGHSMESTYGLQVLRQSKGSSAWVSQTFPMPTFSAKLEFLGSGADSLSEHHSRWVSQRETNNLGQSDVRQRTSRAVFSAVCDSLDGGTDLATGGGPQVVALFREGPGVRIGVHWKGDAYLAGTKVLTSLSDEQLWRDRHFQRVDQAGALLRGAQRHARRPLS